MSCKFSDSEQVTAVVQAPEGERPSSSAGIGLYHHRAVREPTLAEVEGCARKNGIAPSDDDLRAYQDLVSEQLACFTAVSDMPEWTPPVEFPRTPGYRPQPEENPHNAWYYKTDIAGPAATSGESLLAGKTVAMKDNICVAGVPMCNGSVLLEGTIPDVDATVVTRVLRAGGRIAGKAACESMCWVDESFSALTGPVLNPLNPEYSAGGSSSGAAALVASGEVDMAIGADQGGSIRMPASRCGVVGVKPTFGLVPYTGVLGLEVNIDHLGPLARTVTDAALLLEVLAGYDDGLDPRQKPATTGVPKYSQLLTSDLRGLRVGLVLEGFAGCDAAVQEIVRGAAETRFPRAGAAAVTDVSVPWHDKAGPLMDAVYLSSSFSDGVFGQAYGGHGYYPSVVLEALRRGARAHVNDATPATKCSLIAAQFLKDNYGRKYFYKAMNMRQTVIKAYDDIFKQFDVLVMPTLPKVPRKLPKEGELNTKAFVHMAADILKNTYIYDYTGHPALSINAGFHNGLPVGMMIVGPHNKDDVVLKAAYGFEQVEA